MISLWNFIKFLGMIVIILILVGIIFDLIDTIYANIKLNMVKRKAINKLKEAIDENDIENIVLKTVKEDVDKE